MYGAIFIDRDRVVSELSRIARNLVKEEPDVESVVLFGSLADGTFSGTSDADLLVVLKESRTRFADRIPRFLLHFSDAPLPVDVFPYTREEIAKSEFAAKILAEGIRLS